MLAQQRAELTQDLNYLVQTNALAATPTQIAGAVAVALPPCPSDVPPAGAAQAEHPWNYLIIPALAVAAVLTLGLMIGVCLPACQRSIAEVDLAAATYGALGNDPAQLTQSPAQAAAAFLGLTVQAQVNAQGEPQVSLRKVPARVAQELVKLMVSSSDRPLNSYFHRQPADSAHALGVGLTINGVPLHTVEEVNEFIACGPAAKACPLDPDQLGLVIERRVLPYP